MKKPKNRDSRHERKRLDLTCLLLKMKTSIFLIGKKNPTKVPKTNKLGQFRLHKISSLVHLCIRDVY